jgi:hypothetical protein
MGTLLDTSQEKKSFGQDHTGKGKSFTCIPQRDLPQMVRITGMLANDFTVWIIAFSFSFSSFCDSNFMQPN